MFKKVLIANRGEIAVRIIKTLQQMGIEAAAVYAETEAHSPCLRYAGEAWPLSGSSLSETYLNGEKIIEAAKLSGAQAIHPGTGFLAENASFAAACEAAGIVFIGPKAETIRAAGDKLNAKETVRQTGIPVIPGSPPDAGEDPDKLKVIASEIGYPVMLKPAAGGGGKGMHLVRREADFDEACRTAQSEARRVFGDDRILAEKHLQHPRHIEFQIMADGFGHVLHLFERECSVQRRYQKIVEESPSPCLSPALRSQMGAAAVKIAETFGYTNAGTVEFLVDAEGRFYFLEMNTRLQVEHPVTEMILRADLVRLQIEAAAGMEFRPLQIGLRPSGHALECRVYAEMPEKNFIPSTGTVSKYVPPEGPCIRVDSGIAEGVCVTSDYDPLLAKVIVWGESRAEALSRMDWALSHFVILGVKTNLEFLQDLPAHPEFQKGNLSTEFVEEHFRDWKPSAAPEEAILAAACLAAEAPHPQTSRATPGEPPASSRNLQDPWSALGKWRAF